MSGVVHTLRLQRSLQEILARYLAFDASGCPCFGWKHPPAVSPPTAIQCEDHSEYQRGHPRYLRSDSPHYLLRITDGGVLKYDRSPFCIDLTRREVLCHHSLDSVFCTPETYWHQHLAAMQVSETVDLKGRSLLLDARFGKEFYHFYASVPGRTARFLGFDSYLDNIDHFILPEAAPCVVTWADLLGIPREKRVHLVERQLIRAEELTVPSNSYEFDHRTIAFIRNRVPKHASDGWERIYISRARSVNGRHVLNEADVLGRVLTRRGFRVVHLEDFSLEEQAAIMRSARFVIAPYGGGLTNLLFCSPGVRVLEVFSKEWIFFCYARVCSMLGLQAFYHVAADMRGMDIHLDVDGFAAVVDTFLGRQPVG